MPRGFVGALGSLEEVQVVLLIAEPSSPFSYERYDAERDLLEETFQQTFGSLERGEGLIHRNLRFVLDQIFPNTSLADQLRSTWITNTYLCDAPTDGGNVAASRERECVGRYLGPELDLFKGLPIIALGRKAHRRALMAMVNTPNLSRAWAVSPPGCNQPEARRSWVEAATRARALIGLLGGPHDQCPR